MSDPRIENLTKILVHYATAVKKGDKVIIHGFPLDPVATPLIAAVYREVLKAGGHPYTSVDLEGINYIFMSEASDQQLLQPDPFAKMIAEEFDVDIRIGSDTNTRSLMGINPEKWKLVGRAFAEINQTFSQRTGSGDLRWVVSRYPTNAYAQDAKMSLIEFSDFFYSSTFADLDDPLSKWKIMQEKQEKLVRWPDGKNMCA